MKYANIIAVFVKAADIFDKSKDPSDKFRAASYKRAASYLRQFADVVVTKKNIDSLGLTDHMKDKIRKISEDKRFVMADKRESRANADLLHDLTKIKGIGETKARELMEAGLKSIADLKNYSHMLSKETQAYIEMKPSNAPFEHIAIIERIILRQLNKSIKVVFAGSYRRKKPVSRDIDIMLVSDSPNVIERFVEKIKQIFARTFVYSSGEDKTSLLVDFSDVFNVYNMSGNNMSGNNRPDKTAEAEGHSRAVSARGHGRTTSTQNKVTSIGLFYKLDVFRAPVAEAVPMLLYATGSKEFNIAMRAKAKKMGLLLNQHGLFKIRQTSRTRTRTNISRKSADVGAAVNSLERINLPNERAYFDYLNIEYRPPEQR